jgi:hypothetical protein
MRDVDGDRVPHGAISAQTLAVHAPQNGDLIIDIVVDPNDSLPCMGAMQATGILLKRPPPGDGQGEKEGVQP